MSMSTDGRLAPTSTPADGYGREAEPRSRDHLVVARSSRIAPADSAGHKATRSGHVVPISSARGNDTHRLRQ
jgi:hypothetical protein